MIEAEIITEVILHMGHPDEGVNRAAACLIRDICKHTYEVKLFHCYSNNLNASVR